MISRRGLNLFVPILFALLVAMPLAARDTGKNGKATTAEVDILSHCHAGRQAAQAREPIVSQPMTQK